MKNHVQCGDNLTIPAPYNVSSGHGVQVGAIFGVASRDALAGADVIIVTREVFTLDKVAGDDFSIGEAAYWDNAAKLVTTTSAGNTRIGVAVAPAGAGSGTVDVRLNGSF